MSYSKPTDKQVADALPLLASPQHEAHFFARLENPHWIGPLNAAGVFNHPPGPEAAGSGGIRYPGWPPSGYLVRMAAKAPQDVVGIFRSMKTKNVRIVWDMVRATQAMPTEYQLQMLPSLVAATKAGTMWMAFDAAAQLCIALAKEQRIAASLSLAEAMFAPTATSPTFPNNNAEYEYKETLGPVFSALTDATPKLALTKLCGWLSMVLSAKYTAGADQHDDMSALWRPAIEDHDQNHDYDLNSVVLDVVRDCFEQAVNSGKLSFEDALAILDDFPLVVFKRLRLHLLAVFGSLTPRLATQAMLDSNLFQDWRLKHEYAMLMGKQFSLLDEAEKRTWMSWLETGLDMSSRIEAWIERTGEKPSPSLLEDWLAYWKFEHLHWIQAHLKGEDKQFYERMIDEHGVPDMADLNSRVTSRWGSDSPIPLTELEGRPMEEVVERVKGWIPDKNRTRFDADQDGLAGVFEQYLSVDTVAKSEKAALLIGAAPVFVCKFIGRMTGAAKEGARIDIDAVLTLCEWVVKQPHQDDEDQPVVRFQGFAAANWRWARTDVSRFVESVCTARTDARVTYPSNGKRERVWSLLKVLANDEAKSNILRDTTGQDPRLHDALDLGINSPRGRAVEAALEYARWLAHEQKVQNDSREVLPGGLDVVPEVRSLLESELQPSRRSIEVMAVVGSRVSLLHWMDDEWTRSHATQLFDLESIEQAAAPPGGWAAWNAFLVWVPAHIWYYRSFKTRYAYAVSQACQLRGNNDGSRASPFHHLVEHIMLFYVRGELGLDDDDGLVRRLILTAAPDLRRYAMEFLGRLLSNRESIPEEAIRRCREVWELYWNGPGKADAKEEPQSHLFGSWFASGQFDASWSLKQLAEVAEVVGIPEPDYEVAEELARIAPEHLEMSLVILRRMVLGDKDGWHVNSWIESAQSILRNAYAAGGAHREAANEIISLLARRGYTSVGKIREE